MSKRAIVISTFFLLFTSSLYLTFDSTEVSAPNGYPVHNLDTGLNYTSIQSALDASETIEGHTIFVEEGLYSERVTVRKNSLTLFGETRNNTIIDGGGYGSVVTILSGHVTLKNFTIRNSGKADWIYAGISLSDSWNCSIIENTVVLCGSCIIVGDSHRNEIRRNDIINFTYGGIISYSSTFNVIESNYIISNVSWPGKGQLGIHLDFDAEHNIVANNTVVSSMFGIELERSSRNEFTNNTIRDSEYGIVIYNWYHSYPGTQNKFRLNNLSNNHYHLSISGYNLDHYIQDIDTSNIIDGKPVFYLVNQSHKIVDPLIYPKIGFLGLVNCSHITVRNYVVSANPTGVMLVYTTHSNVSNMLVTDNLYGMSLYNSSNNRIYSNTFANNNYSMLLCSSNSNSIFHNNFCNSSIKHIGDLSWVLPDDCPSVNTWDASFPSGGNYWDDYSERYPNATELDSSGIWDTPYVIDEINQDNYPIIPEFPSFILLPLFMLASLLACLVYRRKMAKSQVLRA